MHQLITRVKISLTISNLEVDKATIGKMVEISKPYCANTSWAKVTAIMVIIAAMHMVNMSSPFKCKTLIRCRSSSKALVDPTISNTLWTVNFLTHCKCRWWANSLECSSICSLSNNRCLISINSKCCINRLTSNGHLSSRKRNKWSLSQWSQDFNKAPWEYQSHKIFKTLTAPSLKSFKF